MSKVINVSQKLGQYMLKGWVLTDSPCSNSGCLVPLMRSPQGRQPITYFCPNCDDDPDTASTSTDSLRGSHVSTPLTEVSNLPESPLLAPVLDMEEIQRRREQSDRASQEIGNRLLQGWAMLADECPSSTCYGIPLVRPPKAGGEKDPRKECVICRTVYISEADLAGHQRLVPQNGNNHLPATSRGQGKSEAHAQIVPSQPNAIQSRPHDQNSRSVEYGPSDMLPALGESSKALQSALSTLSTRLITLSGRGTRVDPISISSTADAMLKVTQALSQIKQLEWNERQALLQ